MLRKGEILWRWWFLISVHVVVSTKYFPDSSSFRRMWWSCGLESLVFDVGIVITED